MLFVHEYFMNRTARSPLFQVFYTIPGIRLLCLTGSSLLPDGTDERCVGFVDIGSSQGTVSVVKFFRKDWRRSCRDGRHDRVRDVRAGVSICYSQAKPQEDGVAADFLYRCSEEALGVESMATSLRSEAISRIEQEHNYKAQLAQMIYTLQFLGGKMMRNTWVLTY